ncbi:carbohydrate kinase [Mucilaginibacter roseus]|uniref:Carbohydrate kinase n=1 Tax=Mucilaginibacter roseus TaxID=1528868 RepID=A0ABS8U142_9SPHI|nr:FGGY family carbohydrate kinase [Mucilaginibacter roseus]MCD8739634.1 carbohydrate kinase [Mucilaginibacter roseus]
MLLLGIDIGTSSIKVCIVNADNQQVVVAAQYPDVESPIKSLQPGWAEQDPAMWWEHVKLALAKCQASGKYDANQIAAIGIAYQMHGLVLVDKQQNVLRDSIIWCDSRAVKIGDDAFEAIGGDKCLSNLLNSPGNFTASKLAWVKQNEPDVYAKIDKIMLPGDYIAMKLTGEITTSVSALSEGIFWDFKNEGISEDIKNYFGFDEDLFPPVHPVFSVHSKVSEAIANELGIPKGIPVAYKSGDQPNNALSLNVLNPGEVAATAGTSGVIYGVTDSLEYDSQSRVNAFAHVNYSDDLKRVGILLCINGTGSMYSWAKKMFGQTLTYPEMNAEAEQVAEGSDGLLILPFGNGAERMLNNQLVGAQFSNIDLNIHTRGHVFRAVQEGIACSFRYGLDIMRSNGMNPSVIRAGKNNLFLSELFTQTFVNVTGVPVELYSNDGSAGAALGAGIGAGIFTSPVEAFKDMQLLKRVEPQGGNNMNEIYENWKALLNKYLEIIN